MLIYANEIFPIESVMELLHRGVEADLPMKTLTQIINHTPCYL